MDDFEIVDSPQDVDLDWELLDDADDDDEPATAACEESPNGADHRSSPAVDAEYEQPLTPRTRRPRTRRRRKPTRTRDTIGR